MLLSVFMSVPLKGPQAYQDVPYIERNDRGWRCKLCSTGIMTAECVCKQHCNGFTHRKNYAHFVTSENRYQQKALSARVNTIQHPKWNHHVKACMYDFIMSKCTYAEVHQLVLKYEEWEVWACLELALWKHCCLVDKRFECMQDIEDYWTLDERFDPKKFKQEARLCGWVGAILSRVKSFV